MAKGDISIWSVTWFNATNNDAGEFLCRTRPEADDYAKRREAEGATVEIQPTMWTPETCPPQV